MFTDYLSTWNFVRVSGFLSYFLLTHSLAYGFLQTFPSLKHKKADFLFIHQTSGWVGLLAILFHMMMLYFDQYVHYPILSLLVPFVSENDALYSGLGIISFYLFLIVIGSSDFFMKRMGRLVLRKIHFLAIPAWILMAIHSVVIGTDSKEVWAQSIYIGSIAIVILLGIARLISTVSVNQKSNEANNEKTQ